MSTGGTPTLAKLRRGGYPLGSVAANRPTSSFVMCAQALGGLVVCSQQQSDVSAALCQV